MKKLFLFILILLLVAAWRVYAATSQQLPEVSNLQQLGQEAKAKNLPILILFSMRSCPYCDFIRDDYLRPMLDDPAYINKIIIREIHTDSFKNIVDFEGNKVEAMELAQHYQATLAPTLVFIDSKGQQLVEKMVGVTTPDFYGGYLDRAINQSYQRLNGLVYFQLH
ncbi:MAG: thioredoxin fold domain-containing protein [Gammaproteobacteria bacterium]|nr:thioredoxin fold domain-containing protein [Gammaproteobacteria bacterium]